MAHFVQSRLVHGVSVIAAAIVVPALAAMADAPAATTDEATEQFDAVPFGRVTRRGDGRAIVIRWAEPRKVHEVFLNLGETEREEEPRQIRLQYWHGTWNGEADPVRNEQGAGRVGWERMDDWTNGRWKDAHYAIRYERGPRRITYTLHDTDKKEFPRLRRRGVDYRKTLKIRLISEEPIPEPVELKAFTTSSLRPARVRMHFGPPAADAIREAIPKGDEPGRLEVYNGRLLGLRAIRPRSITVGEDLSWRLQQDGIASAEAGVELELLMTVNPVYPRDDQTIVTVRSPYRSFSFAPADVMGGEHVFVDDLGVLVTSAEDDVFLSGLPLDMGQYRAQRKASPARTVYERVFNQPEQTLKHAWDDMPLKRPLYFVHGLPGDRNAMRQDANGDVLITASRHWFNIPPSPRDTDRKLWAGDMLRIGFGFPGGPRDATRELYEGYLPLLRTWWQAGPIHYEQCTVLDALDADMTDVALDEPSVLLVRVRLVNTSGTDSGVAKLRLASWPARGRDKLRLDGDRVMATTWARDKQGKLPAPDTPGEDRFRYLIRGLDDGTLTEEGDALGWSLELAPGAVHELYARVPSITLTGEEEIAALGRRDFAADARRVCDYWREQTARGAQITTPEPWINDFYKAHVRHLLVNCYKEIGSDRLHAHVGTFSYGVFPDESCMMISDLDRRGYHDEARRNLDALLHYQGTVQMPGNFKTTEGLFYGSGGHDSGGYNKSHGWVMWGMAEHWRYTRDRAWMEAAAPKLVAACDWVTRERQATMRKDADGERPLEYGWLPTGSLEDVTDYWYWMVTNACTVWGFESLVDALADFGHPEVARLRADAQAYRHDFLRGIEEARVRAPVVRLRDGTYVPHYPSRLYERGRCHGWLRETLEGAIHLLITGLIDPDDTAATWILNDFEDNLYISDDYGYAIPAFDKFWFSRGGFSMQANLLHGPLPYLYRDEIRHYVRAVFNGFTSAFYPETRMCNEHSMPELGYPRGDHFKSSDEAQVTCWLRLMFVHERNGDLYLGQAIPRYWLADGEEVAIERAASYFGPLSLRIRSRVASAEIEAELTPPTRNPPRTIYLRLRHPSAAPIRSVTLNGQPYPDANVDRDKEWIILSGTRTGPMRLVARY